MHITALKTGKFAHPEPGRRHLSVLEGETYQVGPVMAASMIDCGWGAPEAPEPVRAPEIKPISKMKKTELIDFAKSEDIGMDETLSKGDMVKYITSAMRVKNG